LGHLVVLELECLMLSKKSSKLIDLQSSKPFTCPRKLHFRPSFHNFAKRYLKPCLFDFRVSNAVTRGLDYLNNVNKRWHTIICLF